MMPGRCRGCGMRNLENILSSLPFGSPFTAEEVREAVAKGKRGRAVGPDRVATELLQAMVKDPSSLESLTQFFSGILATGQTPLDWDKSIVSLLPKPHLPQGFEAYSAGLSH